MKLCLGSLSARLGVKACLFPTVTIPSAREDWERIWQSLYGLVKSVWCKRLKEDLKIKAWVLLPCWHLMPCPMIFCLLLRFVLDFPVSCQAFENERQQRDTVPDLEASAGEPQIQLAVLATNHQMRTNPSVILQDSQLAGFLMKVSAVSKVQLLKLTNHREP